MSNKLVTGVIQVLAVLLGCYMVCRAWSVPITIDESITYFQFVSKGIWLPDSVSWNANNHILNSLLTIWSEKMFGNSELALRLPNLLAGFLYVGYAVRWSNRIQNPFSALTLFIGLTSSQFLLDFFGVCRGYGLSMAFLSVSWFHLTAWWKTYRTTDMVVAIVVGGLAVCASLTTLLPQMLCVGIVFMGFLTTKQISITKRSIGLLIAAVVGVLSLKHPV